jgi:hypothetical protein
VISSKCEETCVVSANLPVAQAGRVIVPVCIKNGILLDGGAALLGLPLPLILKGLSMLAAPTGCDGIVNMKAFDQLGDIGSLSHESSTIMNFSYK